MSIFLVRSVDRKTWSMVDPVRPAQCVAWDQLQTMLVCPPEYIHLYINKTLPPHPFIFPTTEGPPFL